MATIRKFCCNDLFSISSLNLDQLMPERVLYFYMACFIRWSDYSRVAVAPGNRIIGFILGGDEKPPKSEDWQGLIRDMTVASEYRRQGLATKLMEGLEKLLAEKKRLSPPRDSHFFMYLHVGVNNIPAIKMFEKLCYEMNGAIMPNYFPNSKKCKDAYEMRKEIY